MPATRSNTDSSPDASEPGSSPEATGFFAVQSRRLMAPLRRLLPDWLWRWIESGYSFLKARLTRTALLLAVAVAYLIFSDEGKTILVPGPFQIPESLVAGGITERVISFRIQDEIYRIRRDLDRSSRIDVQTAEKQGNDLEVPGTGISLGQIRSFWRSLRGNARRISGEIVEDGARVDFFVRMDGQAARRCTGPRENLRIVLGCAAGIVLENLDPVNAARYYHSRNHGEKIPLLAQALRYADPSPDQMALSFIVEGLYHYYDSRYDQAIFFWEESLRIDPDTPQEVGILYYLGQAYRYSGKCDKAIRKFEEVLKQDPEHVFAYLRWGECLRAQNDIAGARANIETAWRIRPYHTEVLSTLGRLEAAAGDLDKARKNHEMAIHLNPNDPETYNDYAITLREFEKYDEAVPLHRRAIKMDEGYSLYYITLARTFAAAGDLKSARRELQLVQKGPFNEENRARARRTMKELEHPPPVLRE